MDASNSITASVFSAYLKCPMKAHLMAIGEPAPDAVFADVEARISSLYKSVARRRLRVGAEGAEPVDFGQLWRSLDFEGITHYVDCETVAYGVALPPHRPVGHQPDAIRVTCYGREPPLLPPEQALRCVRLPAEVPHARPRDSYFSPCSPWRQIARSAS